MTYQQALNTDYILADTLAHEILNEEEDFEGFLKENGICDRYTGQEVASWMGR